jgi:ArsR family transcriptional regulator, arsenate/arsenite/antimonite-responsive transcriptional repressor
MNNLATVFKALSDEARLRILNLLFLTGELCVCDIESTTGFTQTKVSRHLAYLRSAGLVEDRRQGLWMLYSIAKPKNKEHRQLLECLKSILENNTVASRDARQLAQSIRDGCCATFTEIKPQFVPATLELNKGKDMS